MTRRQRTVTRRVLAVAAAGAVCALAACGPATVLDVQFGSVP